MTTAEGATPRGARTWLTVTVFLSGFAVMVLEMAAVRALAPYFGASTYTWTNAIGIILAALSIGYFLGGRLIDRRPRAALLFSILLAGGLLCLVVAFVVGPVSRWLLPAEEVVEGAVAVVYRASLVATLLLFAPPVFLLGMISPMTIRLLATPGRVGDASGRVFAASTVGSILGTFATTFWLVPGLGSRATIALAGGVLVATALIGLLLTGWSRRSAIAAGGAAIAAVLLGVGVAAAGPLKQADGQVLELESAYQYLRVVDSAELDDTPVRLLQINEAEQAYQSVRVAGTVLTGGRYYDYYSALPLLLGHPSEPGLDAAVIGLAAGTIPAQLRHFYPEGLHVTGIEIDPAVVDLGRRYFDMVGESDWLDVQIRDGRVWLRTASRSRAFDLIVIDAFAQEYYIPFHLATEEAFRDAKDRLRPGGILAMNVSAYRADSELLAALQATLAKVFDGAYRVWVTGYPNWMLFAVKDGPANLGRLLDAPHRRDADWVALRRIAEGMATSVLELSPPDGRDLILTDDRAPVERLTDRSVERASRSFLGE